MYTGNLHDEGNDVFMYWKIHSGDTINGNKVESLRVEKVKTVIQKSEYQGISVALCPCMNEGREQVDTSAKKKYA
jgi:hypothetical protein